MPYYNDPLFREKIRALRTPGQTFSGPFASTQNAVASRLANQANTDTGVTLSSAAADAGYGNANFKNSMAWNQLFGNVGRAAKQIQAEEQIAYQRRMEELARKAAKKKRKRGLVGGALGAIGGAAGLALSAGNPMGGMAGMQAGNMIGNMF